MSILVLSVVLIAGLLLMTIFTKDLRRALETSYSVEAFYAADSAMEWQLYGYFNSGVDLNEINPEMINDTSFDYSTFPNQIKTIGIKGEVRREIETNF